MSFVRFSQQADTDLEDIYAYTADRWSNEQALRYMERLEDACPRLAQMPSLGRLCNTLRPELRRWEEASHVIFYKPMERGILVSRILHKSMIAGIRLS